MECCECRCPLEAADTPCYLYACGDFACYLHVTGPYCRTHPDHLLIDDLERDYAIRELKGLLGRYSQNGYMYSTVAGVRADMDAYVKEILRNGRLLYGPEEGNSGQIGGMCPLCGAYMGGSECQCGSSYATSTAPIYPYGQPILYQADSQAPLMQPPTIPFQLEQTPVNSTCEAEVQTQNACESREIMTENYCERCKLAVNSSYLCAECVSERAVVCSDCKQEIAINEVRCGQCKARNMPISCIKCGKYVANPCCQGCSTPIPPETAVKIAQTDTLLCTKCSNPSSCDVICRKCLEPEVPVCINCHGVIAKEGQTCENCLRLAQIKCSNCPNPIVSGELLCPTCISGKLTQAPVKEVHIQSSSKAGIEEINHLQLLDDSDTEDILGEALPSTPKTSFYLPAFDPKKLIKEKALGKEYEPRHSAEIELKGARQTGKSKPEVEDAPNQPQDPGKPSPISLIRRNPAASPPKSTPNHHPPKRVLRSWEKK